MRNLVMTAALVLGTASIAAPAASQVLTGGLINVTSVSDVNILNDSLNKNQIPRSTTSRPGRCSGPCRRSRERVWHDRCRPSAAGSGGACTATSGNRTLGQAIVRQTLKQKDVKTK